jgi:hypothetical protein
MSVRATLDNYEESGRYRQGDPERAVINEVLTSQVMRNDALTNIGT